MIETIQVGKDKAEGVNWGELIPSCFQKLKYEFLKAYLV
jgi:hypothetical protein